MHTYHWSKIFYIKNEFWRLRIEAMTKTEILKCFYYVWIYVPEIIFFIADTKVKLILTDMFFWIMLYYIAKIQRPLLQLELENNLRKIAKKHTMQPPREMTQVQIQISWIVVIHDWTSFFQLFGSILESFRKHFHLATDVHIILFPYVLYPFTQIAITGSIFMTIAIALERFIAVHYPLDYR